MQYNFKWDPKKAKTNRTKHKVNFELIATVLKYPNKILKGKVYTLHKSAKLGFECQMCRRDPLRYSCKS